MILIKCLITVRARCRHREHYPEYKTDALQYGGGDSTPHPDLRESHSNRGRLSSFYRVDFHPADNYRRNTRQRAAKHETGNRQNQSGRRTLARAARRRLWRREILSALLSAQIGIIPLLFGLTTARRERRGAVETKSRFGRIRLTTILTDFIHFGIFANWELFISFTF